MARNIVNMDINETPYAIRPFATCTTAANVATKTVTYDNFSLVAGATICIRFTQANTAANISLNISGTGAHAIYHPGFYGVNKPVIPFKTEVYYELLYDGTIWYIMNNWS